MKSRNGRLGRLLWLTVIAASIITLAAGCRAPTPAPGTIAKVAPTQGPQGGASTKPSISLQPAGPTVEVQPGLPVPISARVSATDPTVTWSAVCYKGGANCPVLASTTGLDNYFTAPSVPGEIVTVRATVADKSGQTDSATLNFMVATPGQATSKPESTVTAAITLVPGVTPPPTPAVSSTSAVPPASGDVLITFPANNAAIPRLIRVAGASPKDALPAGRHLYVLVRPQDFNWFVQKEPSVTADGWSAGGVNVGNPGDEGMAFRICAVLTTETLPGVGSQLAELPAGASACVDVTRAGTPPPPPAPPVGDTPTGPAPVISLPTAGSDVNAVTVVSGPPLAAPLPANANLWVLAGPADVSIGYWVQSQGEFSSAGWRAGGVNLGDATTPKGMAFNICAVITNAQLSRGAQIADLPAGPSTCIKVTRK